MADAPVMGPRQNPGTRRSDLWPGADQHQYRIPEQGQPGMVNDHGLVGQLAGVGSDRAARDSQRRALQPGFGTGGQRPPAGTATGSWRIPERSGPIPGWPANFNPRAPMDDGRTQLLNALMRLRLGSWSPPKAPALGAWKPGMEWPGGNTGQPNPNGVS